MNDTEPAAFSGQADRAGLLPENLAWAVVKNTVAQVAARVFVAGARFGAAILMARTLGLERFGEYALILSLLIFCEALLDFGFNDIFVREICRRPERKHRLLSTLAYGNVFKLAVGYGLLVALLFALRYPKAIVCAGLVAGLELVFLAGILVYRALFKATLRMARDVLAETLSVVVFLGMLVYLCLHGGSLTAIFGAFVASRGVYFGLAFLLGRRGFNLRLGPWAGSRLLSGFLAALPVGISMFLVAVYSRLDILMLSKLDAMRSVALYSAAFAFVFPLLHVPVSLMQALYPILSLHWGRRMDEVGRIYQQGIDWAVLLAGGMFCVLQAAAGFLMGLFRPEAVEAAPALRLLAWAIGAMFLTAMLGPVFIIGRRQWLGLLFCGCGLALNGLLNALLIPRYSYMGAVVATLATEVCFLVSALCVVQRMMRYRLRWWVLVKVVAVTAASLAVVAGLGLWDTVWGGLAAGALFGIGALATRAVRIEQVRGLISGGRGRS